MISAEQDIKPDSDESLTDSEPRIRPPEMTAAEIAELLKRFREKL